MERNSFDNTIQFLLDYVRQEQRNEDAGQLKGLKSDLDGQLQALMELARETPELREALLRFTGTQGQLERRHCDFHFQAGVQLGLALGGIGVLQGG